VFSPLWLFVSFVVKNWRVNLPRTLAAAIEQEVSRFDSKALIRAAQELSLAYRGGSQTATSPIRTDLHRAAYLLTRSPATYAALRAVFEEARPRIDAPLHSLLDLGSGPGTAAWAAVECFPALRQITMVEQDADFMRFGKELAAKSDHSVLQTAEWRKADLRAMSELPAHDLVVLSYSLGELAASAQQVLQAAWRAARVAVVVIEPGTPRGYATVLQARTEVITEGGWIAAPCPHHLECPMTTIPGEWCHFAARVQRSSLHRRAKSADLGYEDEKFSYVVGAKTEVTHAASRIVRHPIQRKGHITLELCTPAGLRKEVVTKSQREDFRRARKAGWGDAWDFPVP
jgi:ribosomal protein RSM22 (predicted rRNA methylase)